MEIFIKYDINIKSVVIRFKQYVYSFIQSAIFTGRVVRNIKRTFVRTAHDRETGLLTYVLHATTVLYTFNLKINRINNTKYHGQLWFIGKK